MPSGAAIIRYDGKRGTVWRMKYTDAGGRQIMETLGRESDEWTEKKAERELRHRLTDIERRGWRKPAPLAFAEYVERWFDEGPTRRAWKASTVAEYRSVRRRLVNHFGAMPLAAVRPRDVAAYVTALGEDYSPASINRDIAVLHAVFRTARREELIESNPAEAAERPRVRRKRWRILEPAEVARVAKAFGDEQARVVFLTLVLTGIRRAELQALRWRDVALVEKVLRVRDSKSEDGIRAIALTPTLAGELSQHWRRSAYQGDDERVFCHPTRGSIYSADTFDEALRAALLTAGVEGRVRAFHDLRHTAITNDAAAGSSAIAVMTKAGHADMRTTKTYLHLAGVVFREEAEALERRLLSTDVSTDLREPETVPAALGARSDAG